jgi:hypothetical protein
MFLIEVGKVGLDIYDVEELGLWMMLWNSVFRSAIGKCEFYRGAYAT